MIKNKKLEKETIKQLRELCKKKIKEAGKYGKVKNGYYQKTLNIIKK